MVIRWQRHSRVQWDSNYFDWFNRSSTEGTPNRVGVIKVLFGGGPLLWDRQRPWMVGAPFGVAWAGPVAAPTATMMGLLRATHRRVFSRVFGRVN